MSSLVGEKHSETEIKIENQRRVRIVQRKVHVVCELRKARQLAIIDVSFRLEEIRDKEMDLIYLGKLG